MSIPDYETIMLPLLKHLANVQSATSKECVKFLSDEFRLTDEEKRELLPSGKQAIFNNRVGWARTYLKKVGLFEIKNRGVWSISERGKRELENEMLTKIDSKYLTKFKEFREFQSPKDTKNDLTANVNILLESKKTPKEMLEESFAKMRDDLAQELLSKTKECSPEFFERLVVDLLLKIGYGGSRNDAGKAIGQTGDGGIDGIIHEDRLGLDSIYIQAKRWDGATVGRPEIQKFVGAMVGRQRTKGIFITTSSFSQETKSYALSVQGMKVRLIDGKELSQYMIDFDIGTSKEECYELKKIDSDYFLEE